MPLQFSWTLLGRVFKVFIVAFCTKNASFTSMVVTGATLQSFMSFLIYNCAEIAESYFTLSRISLTLACPMNLKLYPMDRQTCSIRMASCKYYDWCSIFIILCILLTFVWVSQMYCSNIADGYTTDDILYLWKDTDPVQIAQNLSLPRFSIENYASSYCNVKTNTGKFNATLFDAFSQPCNVLCEKKAFTWSFPRVS